MPSDQTILMQNDFSGGLIRNIAPHLIQDNGAYDIVNGALEEDGSVYRRGGTAYKSGAAFGAGLRFLWDGYLRPGRRTLTANEADFGVLDANDSTMVNLGSDGMLWPKQAASLQDILFIGGGYLYGGSRKAAVYSTGTVTTTVNSKVVTGSGTTWNTLVDAGMLFQTAASERVYVVDSIDSTTQITLRDPYQGTTGAGKTYSLNPLYKLTAADPYEPSESYCVAGDRLLWIDAVNPAIVRFSRQAAANDPADATVPYGSHSYVSTEDYHEIPDGGRALGIAAVGPQVLIFATNGTYTLSGIQFDIVDAAGNPQQKLNLLSRDLVLWGGPAGLGSWESYLVVPATNGIYLLDGVSAPTLISRSIDPLYHYYTARNYRTGGATVHRDHYMLPILKETTEEVYEFLVGRLDRAALDKRRRTTFPWVRFSEEGAQLTALAERVGESIQQPTLLGAEQGASARIVDASAFFSPDDDHKEDAGGAEHVCHVVTRDYETGNNTKNSVRSIRTRYELRDAATDDPEIDFAYGGGAVGVGTALWDQVAWDAFEWGADVTSTFINLNCPGPESDGRDPHRCRINQKARFIRYRMATNGACGHFALRSLEQFTRPSRTVRN